MRTIDLTHTIRPDMPVFPGMEQPVLENVTTIASHGFAEKRITMFSHTGTHMDAPAHMLPHGKTLDALPADAFTGTACVIDVRDAAETGTEVGAERIAAREAELRDADFLLLHTGWDSRWGSDSYFDDFPVLTEDAAKLLVEYGCKGVGVDAISVDPVGDDMRIHNILLSNGLVIVENLTGLGQLSEARGQIIFCALPCKFANADGAPVRAVALLDR